jgi:hypothetical protein
VRAGFDLPILREHELLRHDIHGLWPEPPPRQSGSMD